MPYFVALAIIASLLSAVNLVFTLGVIRRLRDHTKLLEEEARRHVVASMGDSPNEFAATTVDGGTVSSETLALPTLVAFFTTGCAPCEDALPRFVEYAAAFPGGREHVLAVVTGPPAETVEFGTQLEKVARVVVEPPSGPVQTAFAVDGSPAFGVVDRHRVIAVSTRSVDDLPVSVHS